MSQTWKTVARGVNYGLAAAQAAGRTTPATFFVEPGATSGAQVKAILDAVTGGLTKVDIVLLPGDHIWNAQPNFRPEHLYVRIRGMGNTTRVILKPSTARGLDAETGGERFLDFRRTADYQSFGNLYIEDLLIDCDNVWGIDSAGHVVIGTQRFSTIQARIDIHDLYIRRVNTVNVPFDPSGGTTHKQRGNVLLYVHHPESNEATRNTIRDIHIEDCNFSGGGTGILIGGHAGAVVPATTKVQANVLCDNIFVEGGSHDSTAVFTGTQLFQFSSNIQIGDRGYCGRVVIRDFRGRNSPDVGIELDSPSDALVENVDIIDCRGPAFISINYNDQLPYPARQRVVYEGARALVLNVPEGVQGLIATTNGSNQITVPGGIQAQMQEGQVISAPGVPYNTTIAPGGIAGTTITMSANATATNASVMANFATWQPKGFMLGVYANSQGQTAPLGHVTYRSCEWHRPNKTNMTKGEAFYCQGTAVRDLVVNDFKLICDSMALATTTLNQPPFWCFVSPVDAGGRASVALRDVYFRVQGSTTGGEVRLMALGGGHFDVQSPTFSQDLTGATATTIFPITLAQDGQVEGRIAGFRTEKMTFNAGWGYYGIRSDGGGVVKNMIYEDCDFTQYSALTADVDRIISFNTDAQAGGVKYRNIRGPGTINGFDRRKLTANATLRDWEEFAVLGAAGLTATLPKAARIAPGRTFRVKDEFGSGGTVGVQGADTIDGAATKAVAANATASIYSANADVAGKLFST